MTSFDLPLSSDVLYLFSRGALSKGDIVVQEDKDAKDGVVRVEVMAKS